MSIERLKHTKEMLMAQVEGQLGHLNNVDAKELGEVVDMIKDLEEAIYYCTITEAMKKKEEEPITHYQERRGDMYYHEREPYLGYNRQYEGTRQYSENGNGGQKSYYNETVQSSSGNSNNHSQYSENGSRSDVSRRMYMEHKKMHSDKTVKMRDLENYMTELSHDMTEMIEGASPEEKQLLQQKIATLAQKIV